MKGTIYFTQSHSSFICIVIWVSLLHLINIGKVAAQELETKSIPYQDISSGSLYFKSNNSYLPALTQNSNYQVNVNGLLARVNFTQTFKNSSNDFLEAVYVFPLIDDAAVDSMVMEIGKRRIIGKIKEKHQAQKLYRKAKKQGKKVSLVSEQRPNLFTTKIANIAPGEIIKISLSYLQSVALNDETFALRIPLTLTPRYIPLPQINSSEDKGHPYIDNSVKISKIKSHGWAMNNARVTDASEITPFQKRDETINSQKNTNPQQTVTIAINLNSSFPLTQVISRYHKINKMQFKDNLSITLADKNTLLNQDFVLQWKLTQGKVPKAAFFQQSDHGQTQNDYQYGLLMLMPPKRVHAQIITKEVVYIIDTSGSMGGVAIRQAKQSLITALDFLNPNDSFNIISFNDDTQSIFRYSKLANTGNIAQAKHWLSNLTAGGGTNMYPAIERALQPSQSDNSYRQIIFITDGSVGNEDELFDLIDRKLAKTRLHTIGIGSAPNGYFMSQAAKIGRGTYRYIGSINEVNGQMTELFSQISKPLMKNIELTWPIEQVEMFPQEIPDLYFGQPLLISARWPKDVDKGIKQVINVSGKLASTTWQEQVDITNGGKENVKEGSSANVVDNGVSQWWAREKINHLTLLHRRSSAQNKAEREFQITQLALKHQIVSPYTSFIAIEEVVSRKTNRLLQSKSVKNLMPKGSTQVIPLANTALGVVGYFYFGLMLILVAIFIQVLAKTCFLNPS